MKKILIFSLLIILLLAIVGYFSLSNQHVQNFLLKSLFESRMQALFAESESDSSDELEIFFCGSGSPLSMMPEGAQCMAFVIGSDIYVIDNGENSFAKISDGFSKLTPSILCILFMCITMFSIAKAMSALPVGFAYSTYSGLTVTGVVLFAVLKFNQIPNLYGIIGIILIIIGVIMVNYLGQID